MQNEIAEKKIQMRKSVKSRLSRLTWTYKREASEFIASKVLHMQEYIDAQHVLIYVSTEDEPDTERVAADCFARGKHVYVPRCLALGVMEIVEIKSYDDLIPGKYGIREPRAEFIASDPKVIDLCLVPCMAAGRDSGGRITRLGHGAGYYDRFLPQTSATTCVLCFKEMQRSDIPMDEHDRFIDRLITE